MLNWISIKNLALVEEADIEFGPGFNVITGETGAGKSVLIGTISMLLGERADKSVIRTGASRCEISAGITLRKDIAKRIFQILDDAGLPFTPENPQLQLRRVITATSTRNFINDSSASLQTLKAVGDCLIDVHGPNEHQSLLRQAAQLEVLDSYAHLEKSLNGCSEICAKIKAVREKKEKLASSLPSPAEAGHLRMMISDIEKVSPAPAEDQELSARFTLAANSKNVIETASRTINTLNEAETSVSQMMGAVYRDLQQLEKMDPERVSPLLEKCDRISETVRELASGIESYTGNIELDEKEFHELEERLSSIQSLKRRYGPSLDDVFSALSEAKERLMEFENSEDIRKRLDAEEKELETELKILCAKLSEARKKAAEKFRKELCAELKKLGFLKSDFSVDFIQTEPGTKGWDKIDFLFSANPGEAIQPLRNIASSGEISRVMLALKTVLAESDSVPVLIFDEIDMSIGH